MLFAAGLLALYFGALRTGFLNDDYLFLEQARTHPLLEWITRLDALGNYWRPLSRQLYFETLAPIAGGQPGVFHAVNFALFLAALALLADLMRVFAGPPGVIVGVAWFALLPMQRVNLMWISCSQDLLALVGALGAVALWRRERLRLAALAWLAALLAKESALPLPLALLAWEVFLERRPPGISLKRLMPFAWVGAAWLVTALGVRARHGGVLPVHVSATGLPATLAHLAQSLLGIEHPSGFARALTENGPALLPLLLLAAIALVWPRPAEPGAALETEATAAGSRFALAWLGAFALATWPVAHTWSGYYYTLAAVGSAILIALIARRLDRLLWPIVCGGLLWWHAAGTGTRAFAVADRPWGWTSHLTTYYFARGAALTDTLARQLGRIEPAPAPHTRFFFATLPPWAGFQMGNGPLVRALYRDTTLASHYYSQFSDTTAGADPCRFYYWDGVALQRLYGEIRDPFFQVGCDLMLLDRPAGAAHAFRRAIAAGGRGQDDLYWLGWSELWSGRRDAAEAAWNALGARDDSLAQARSFAAVREVLYVKRDTLTARRLLLEAIHAGIGLPSPHAVLGELLLARGGEDARYGLLELRVATWLNPRDVLARRELLAGLVDARLDDQARRELAGLQQIQPEWRNDTLTARAVRTLERRTPVPSGVAASE